MLGAISSCFRCWCPSRLASLWPWFCTCWGSSSQPRRGGKGVESAAPDFRCCVVRRSGMTPDSWLVAGVAAFDLLILALLYTYLRSRAPVDHRVLLPAAAGLL